MCFFFLLLFAWCGISRRFGRRSHLLCSFLNRVSPLPSIFLPSNANPQAGGPQRPPPSSTPERAGDRPSITQRRPSHSPLPRASNQTFLSHPKQKEFRQLEQFHPRRRFRDGMEARTPADAPKGARFHLSPLVSRVLPVFLIFLSRVRTDFGRVAVPPTHAIQRASPTL